jgi:hypothetical protein
VGIGRLRCGYDIVVAGTRTGISDVLGDTAREEDRLLEDESGVKLEREK